MYSIGQFSLMFQINKKTLRYYDEIGLLKPDFVDENNQYRYYGENQIAVMKEIMRLKDVGLPLEKIHIAVNGPDHAQLFELYDKRLYEIEEAQKLLAHQKKLLMAYKRNERKEEIKNELQIDTGYFIEKGFIYSRNVNCDMNEIQNQIGIFYEQAKGIQLLSPHIFRMNMEEDSNGVTEIFAYTDTEQGDHVKNQEREMCIKVECMEMRQRTDGYHALFEYVEKNYIMIQNIYEKYTMEGGGMRLEIIAS